MTSKSDESDLFRDIEEEFKDNTSLSLERVIPMMENGKFATIATGIRTAIDEGRNLYNGETDLLSHVRTMGHGIEMFSVMMGAYYISKMTVDFITKAWTGKPVTQPRVAPRLIGMVFLTTLYPWARDAATTTINKSMTQLGIPHMPKEMLHVVQWENRPALRP